MKTGQHVAGFFNDREAGVVPSLEAFQARWDRTCSNLVEWKVSLWMEGVDELKGHLQPKPF